MTTNFTTRQETTPPSTSANGSWTTDGAKPTSRLRTTKRRRSIPHLLLGALLVVACAVAFVMVSLNVSNRHAVLALARPVSVGHVLTAQDLKQVNIAEEPGISIVDAGQATSLVGKTMSESLPEGAVLTPDAVSGTGIPTAGQAIVALSLKAGQFPPEVSPGTHVSIVFAPGQAGTTLTNPPTPGTTTVWRAVVASVTPLQEQQITVVSTQVSQDAADQIAAVPAGQLSIVMLPGRDQ